jgi:hypothetical protein
MKTITIRLNDLTSEKRDELMKLYPFDNLPDSDSIVTFVQMYDKDDLDLDVEKARVELKFENPEVH